MNAKEFFEQYLIPTGQIVAAVADMSPEHLQRDSVLLSQFRETLNVAALWALQKKRTSAQLTALSQALLPKSNPWKAWADALSPVQARKLRGHLLEDCKDYVALSATSGILPAEAARVHRATSAKASLELAKALGRVRHDIQTVCEFSASHKGEWETHHHLGLDSAAAVFFFRPGYSRLVPSRWRTLERNFPRTLAMKLLGLEPSLLEASLAGKRYEQVLEAWNKVFKVEPVQSTSESPEHVPPFIELRRSAQGFVFVRATLDDFFKERELSRYAQVLGNDHQLVAQARSLKGSKEFFLEVPLSKVQAAVGQASAWRMGQYHALRKLGDALEAACVEQAKRSSLQTAAAELSQRFSAEDLAAISQLLKSQEPAAKKPRRATRSTKTAKAKVKA